VSYTPKGGIGLMIDESKRRSQNPPGQ
jgi:hypothetical protein